MGLIGRWVDEMVRYEPELMQKVYDTPWGDVGLWQEDDCEKGCLIGTCVIVMARNELYRSLITDNGYAKNIYLDDFKEALLNKPMPDWVGKSAEMVGIKVSSMMRGRYVYDKDASAIFKTQLTSRQVEAIVKARIARRLAEAIPTETVPSQVEYAG